MTDSSHIEMLPICIGEPHQITVTSDRGNESGTYDARHLWFSDTQIVVSPDESSTSVTLSSRQTGIKIVSLRWNLSMPKDALYLGDEWERGYGTMGFHNLLSNRFMPWYFIASQADGGFGYGVRVRPNAMCFWQIDAEGITLVLDVRNGGMGVQLHGEHLELATIIARKYENATAMQTAQQFCSALCDDPLLPNKPVYGSNNWYYAYGDSTERDIMQDTDYLAKLSEGNDNRPYMIIDDGWQIHHRINNYNGGPWREGNSRFPDMQRLADYMRDKSIKPGIWTRLLLNDDPEIPCSWRLKTNGCLDPSCPDALEYIAEDIRTMCGWGYRLLKHDFSTFDLFGLWGFQMNPYVTHDGWHLYDRTITNAQMVKRFYARIHEETARFGALVLGCNTIGHLGAGLMHIQRAGDDTSGIDWERTRQMGINTLAFRLPQHRRFFDIDADCIGIGPTIDWKFNRQWAEVVANSGTPFFFSAKPESLTPAMEEDLRKALRTASIGGVHAIPLDWQQTDCPESWGDETGIKKYMWFDQRGLQFNPNPTRSVAILSNISE
ncbi:hypothetical protein [Bifidobacterium aquikefiri]|uniref:hypothetical protein n=1 Tax=Bifidobacterium aquikefiri TaxID=1653207 RepID=UPI0039EC920D